MRKSMSNKKRVFSMGNATDRTTQAVPNESRSLKVGYGQNQKVGIQKYKGNSRGMSIWGFLCAGPKKKMKVGISKWISIFLQIGKATLPQTLHR
jgi:hypothetical protein